MRLCALIVSIAGLAGAVGSVGQEQSSPHQHPSPQSKSNATPPAAAGHQGMSMPADTGNKHETNMAFGPLADTQEASGTAWQPAGTPMHARHFTSGNWTSMVHYNAFLGYDVQSGPRGDEQLNSVNWLMLMSTRRTEENEISFRGMFSLEPATTTKKGYPLLFQSGEAYNGQPLIDRQHPHDFFMELSARYRRMIEPDTVFSLYLAPSGEPALGPPAFPHRLSAMDNPAAPISHHWLDSTHISFGVVTLGVARKTWQLEGSWFNGREPDEDRWDIDRPELDSYSGRFTWNPTADWSAQFSHGYLDSPEELHPEESARRTTASLMHLTKLTNGGHFATTFGWGQNDHGEATHAFLIEPSYMMDRYTVFGRAEYVQKTGEELGLPSADRTIGVKQLTLGASRELVNARPYQLALGASLTYTFKPGDLDATYGRKPVGVWIFLRLRPAAMEH